MYKVPFNQEFHARTKQDIAKRTIEDSSKPGFTALLSQVKTETEATALLQEIKRAGWVKGFVANETPGAEEFGTFMKTWRC